MLIRFTDDYINDVNQAFDLLGRIQTVLALREPFMGTSKALDNLYAISVILSGIIDHLNYDDNSNPKFNEHLLLCIRKLINKNICGPQPPKIIDVRNYHQDLPIGLTNPVAGIITTQNNTQITSGATIIPAYGQ